MIKYHVNLPVDTNLHPLTAAIKAVTDALTSQFTKYNIVSINGWVSTLGEKGWRISIVFNPPFPSNAAALTTPISNELYILKWETFAAVSAWIHP